MSYREINRQAIIDDERVQRLIKMKIIEQETKEFAPKFKESQMLQFPQAIPISNVPTLGEVISEEQTASAMNEEMLYQRAEAKLKTIAPRVSVEFILDRLDRQDLFYLNNSWSGVLKKIREEYSTSGLDKMAFIGIIKSGSERFFDVTVFEREGAIGLTDRGEKRKQNIQEQIDELQQKINEQNARYDQETTDFEQKVLTDEAERKAKKQEEDDRRDRARKQEKVKKFIRNQTDKKRKEKDEQAIMETKKQSLQQELKSKLEEKQRMEEETRKRQQETEDQKATQTNQKKKSGRKSQTSKLTPENLERYNKEKDSRFAMNMKMSTRKTYLSKFVNDLLKEQNLKATDKYEPLPPDDTTTIMYPSEVVGKGLKSKKRRVVIGGGGEEVVSPIEVRKRKNETNKKIINGKYIDMGKFNDGILTLRYCSTSAVVPTMKTQRISKDVKDILNDIFNDKFEKRIFEKLSQEDKKVVKRFATSVNLDIDLHTMEDDEYNKQYNIILGEWRAGNDNPDIIRKLKSYVTDSLESNFMPRREAFRLLYELANA